MVYLLFFLSGAAGLIYEIAWSRQLGLFFGHTVHAAAVVLGAYFAGMALGYWLAGRWAPRLKRPLRGYGVAELVVAAWAVATPHLLGLFAQPQLAALLNNENIGLQLTVRAVVTFLVLLPATVALGATLPFIAQHVSATAIGALGARRIAFAYGLNTAGAFTGVLAATFVLILYIGVTGSGYLAALISALCGLAALWLARRNTQTVGRPDLDRPLRMSWYVLAGLSGLGTLGLQVLFTRMFALTFHNSTYTFGGVVAVFLIALACGSWLVARFSERWRPAPTAAYACALGSIAILTGVGIFQRFTQLGYFDAGPGFLTYILAALGLIALVVFAPVLLLGTVLPYCFSAAPTDGRGLGGSVGRLTAVNTICAAAGALATSFLLLPALGLWNCFALYAVLYAVTAVIISGARIGAARITLPALALLLAVAAGVVLTHWPLSVVSKNSRLLFERETPYGLITVLDANQGLFTWLKQNNHYTLGATTGADSELRQGYMPLLLHPAPREVCFLGLATGITAGAAVDFPGVEHITTVELIPEVVEAAGYFEAYNAAILKNARSEIVINDARHYLYATDRRFDVIVSDLFVPWHSQTGYLYTVEHYRAARRRLAPGGIFCQWLPLYQVGSQELELIADSFASVFPVTTVWRGEIDSSSPLLALIGSEEPLTLDGARLLGTWAQVPLPWCGRDTMLSRGTDVLSLYVGRWPEPWDTHEIIETLRSAEGQTATFNRYELRANVADGGGAQHWADLQYLAAGERDRLVLNTDDHPRVEFLAPLTQQQGTLLKGKRLRRYYEDVLLKLPISAADARQAGPALTPELQAELSGIEYIPLQGEPQPDLGRGRQRQFAAFAPSG